MPNKRDPMTRNTHAWISNGDGYAVICGVCKKLGPRFYVTLPDPEPEGNRQKDLFEQDAPAGSYSPEVGHCGAMRLADRDGWREFDGRMVCPGCRGKRVEEEL